MGVTLHPARYVLIELAEAVTGYTVKAIENKIARGEWRQGREPSTAPRQINALQ